MLRHSLGRSTIGAVAAGLVGQGALIVSGIVVARALGAEDRGYLALILLFPLCLSTLIGAGVPAAVIYHMAQGKAQVQSFRPLVTSVLSRQAAVIVVLHALLLMFYLSGKPTEVVLAGWTSLMVGPVTLAQEYGFALIQGQRRFADLNRFRILMPSSYAVAVLLLFVSGGAALSSFVLTWLFALTASSIAAFVIAFRAKEGVAYATGNVPSPGALVRFGLKGLLGSASPIETYRLDQLLAGLLLSPAALGLYVVGRAFANIPAFIASSITTVAFPSVASAGRGAAGNRLVWTFFLAAMGSNVLVVVAMDLLIPWLLPLAFGEEYRGSIVVAQLLLVGTTLYGGYRVLGECMRGLGLPQVSSIVELCIWPWLLVGLPWFGLIWGVSGVALAVVIGYLLALIITLLLARRFGVWIRKA